MTMFTLAFYPATLCDLPRQSVMTRFPSINTCPVSLHSCQRSHIITSQIAWKQSLKPRSCLNTSTVPTISHWFFSPPSSCRKHAEWRRPRVERELHRLRKVDGRMGNQEEGKTMLLLGVVLCYIFMWEMIYDLKVTLKRRRFYILV
jgi:hypothetical protein